MMHNCQVKDLRFFSLAVEPRNMTCLSVKPYILKLGRCSICSMKCVARSRALVVMGPYSLIPLHEEQKGTEWLLLMCLLKEKCHCKGVTVYMFLIFPDVHNAEFVLTGVLTQTLDYESYPFCVKALSCSRKMLRSFS